MLRAVWVLRRRHVLRLSLLILRAGQRACVHLARLPVKSCFSHSHSLIIYTCWEGFLGCFSRRGEGQGVFGIAASGVLSL